MARKYRSCTVNDWGTFPDAQRVSDRPGHDDSDGTILRRRPDTEQTMLLKFMLYNCGIVCYNRI